MNSSVIFFAVYLAVLAPAVAAEQEAVDNPVSTTAVYGIREDAAARADQIKKQLRPEIRRKQSRVAFNLPDSFFYMAVPVFLLVFIRIYVSLLDDIEQLRIDELRADYRAKHGIH